MKKMFSFQQGKKWYQGKLTCHFSWGWLLFGFAFVFYFPYYMGKELFLLGRQGYRFFRKLKARPA